MNRWLLDVSEELIEHGLRLVCLINLLLDLLKLLFKLGVGDTFVLLGFRLIHFVEGLKLFRADVIDNTAEVALELTELALHALFEDLGINNGVVQVQLFTAFLLKFSGDNFVISAKTNTELVVSEFLEAETEIPFKVLDDLIFAFLRLVHHLKKLVELGLTIRC